MSDLISRYAASPQIDDPLAGAYAPERVNYATGVMLQADDFQAEQTYHRGRLAQFARHLLGFGTLAGLRVHAPAPAAGISAIEVRVEPGLALDRHGRLIEVSAPYCIDIGRWFAEMRQQQPARLRSAIHAKPRTPLDLAVVADIFLSAHHCGRGKTPSFAAGPFDALDALVSSRLAETPRIEPVLRVEGNPPSDPQPGDPPPVPGPIPKPANFWPKPSGSAAEIAAAQLEAVLASWDYGFAEDEDRTLEPLAEHVRTGDPSAILLARIGIPVTADADPAFLAATPIWVDNSLRPIIFFPGKWMGTALTPAPAT